MPTLPLDEAAAARAITVFGRLRIPDVVGTPLMRDASGDWIRDIVGALFGSIDPTNGRRRVREPFLLSRRRTPRPLAARPSC